MPWLTFAILVWLYLVILDLFGLILILYRSYSVKLADLVQEVKERLAECETLQEKNEQLAADNASLAAEKDRLATVCAEQAAAIDYAEEELSQALGLSDAPAQAPKKSKRK